VISEAESGARTHVARPEAGPASAAMRGSSVRESAPAMDTQPCLGEQGGHTESPLAQGNPVALGRDRPTTHTVISCFPYAGRLDSISHGEPLSNSLRH
jgi:hypothetical protein